MVTANWTSLDSPNGWDTQTDLGVGKNANGVLEIFTVASDKALWYRKQITIGMDWGNWASLGQPLPGLNGYTAVAANKDGRLEVFSTGIDGALWHIWQITPNGNWSTWGFLGTPPGANSISYPATGQNADGRLEAFVIGFDNALWHKWQSKPGGTWGGWFSLGKPSIANAFFIPFVRKNDDGRLEVFTVGTDGALWNLWQVAPNGTWSNWTSLGNPPTANVQSAPSVRKNKDGRLEAFNICSDGALWHIWQITPGGVWGSWDSLGMPSDSVVLSAGPIVVENVDGRLEAFVGGLDNAIWHAWQVSPGGSWSS
jgi:acylphosphatase